MTLSQSISIYVDEKYRKQKLDLAQPEAWVALLKILVSVTLCKKSSKKALAHFQRERERHTNDENLEEIKIKPVIYVCHIHVPYITKQM